MIQATFVTHVGLVRNRNEDTLLAPGLMSLGSLSALTVRYPSRAEGLLFAVVDGMGGHRGGQEASRLAVQHLADNQYQSLTDALHGANRELYDEMVRSPHLLGMGATIAAARLDGDLVTLGNVGDARGYHFANSNLMRITTDDRRAPDSNIVTQSLGGADRATAVDPHISEFTTRPGERVLLCSDGLSEVVDFDTIERLLGTDPAVTAAELLLRAALDEGAPDNVSMIILERDGDG